MPVPRRATRVATALALVAGALVPGAVVAAAAPAPGGSAPVAASATTALPAWTSSVSTVSREWLGSSYRSGSTSCPVAAGDLRKVTFRHVGYDGTAKNGTVVVHARYAASTQRILERLYATRFPIERAVPVQHYGGDDETSMRANSTSGFNCRKGEHGKGAALDVNPLHNPYVKGSTVLPATATAFVDRNRRQTGLIRPGDAAVKAFAAEGWRWGGDWRTLKDYQHFSVNGL